MTTFNYNFEHQREIDNLRQKMEVQTRMELKSQGERKHEAIDKEIDRDFGDRKSISLSQVKRRSRTYNIHELAVAVSSAR